MSPRSVKIALAIGVGWALLTWAFFGFGPDLTLRLICFPIQVVGLLLLYTLIARLVARLARR